MIVQELQNFTSFVDRRVLKDKTWMDLLNKLSAELSGLTGNCHAVLCMFMSSCYSVVKAMAFHPANLSLSLTVIHIIH